MSLNSSPAKIPLIKSPQSSTSKTLQTNWQEILKTEQEKNHRHSNIQAIQEVEQIHDGNHPYIQTVLVKTQYSKRNLVKPTQLSAYSTKDYQIKERNLLTDLPDQQQFIFYNGIGCQMKKAFGQSQNPINKSIHFISNQSVIFFVGNYIALHNVVKDSTKYIGIEANLSDITAFEVRPIEQTMKSLVFSPTKGPINLETQISTSSPPQTRGESIFTNEITTKTPLAQQTQQSTFYVNPSKEMQTLIAFAEKAKSTYIKESKFSTKRVYGFTVTKNKRSGSVDMRSTGSLLKSPKRV